jgi:hypothetical protein
MYIQVLVKMKADLFHNKIIRLVHIEEEEKQ